MITEILNQNNEICFKYALCIILSQTSFRLGSKGTTQQNKEIII